jgi:hypothetical protein
VSSGYIPAKDEPGPEEILEALEELSPEERHRIYKLLRLGVRFRPEWPPRDHRHLLGGG